MAEVILRVYEGQPLPDNCLDVRVLQAVDEPYGPGTNMWRVYTVLVTDGRYWLSDAEKCANPLRNGELAAPQAGSPPKEEGDGGASGREGEAA